MDLLYKNQKYLSILLGDLGILFITLFVKKYLQNSELILLFGSILFIINTLRIWFEQQLKKLLNFMIRYRYLITLILFILLVFCRINGSSIGVFDTIYGKENGNVISEIFGKGRIIRSDEYRVQIPYFFSQIYNNFGLDSHMMSLSGQNMIIGYNSPVLDLTLIGKPDLWGYILFGNEVGLSWYWNFRIIAFLLVGYEMFMILTRNKYLSAFASVCLVFSPALQWWFAPHMYQVFFWASTLFVVGYYFFISHSIWKKVLFTVLSISALVGFVVSIFPSLQVSLGLLMLVLMICCLIRDRKELNWKNIDFLRVAIVVVIAGGILGKFLIESKTAIQLLNSTVYPGKRISTGGNYPIANLFSDPAMMLTPFQTPKASNECEISCFNHLGMLFILYYPYLWYVIKKKCGSTFIGNSLFIILLIEMFFMLIGFPAWLSKITLFSYMNRMVLVYGFTALLFTFWSIQMVWEYRKYLRKSIALMIGVVYICLYIAVYKNYGLNFYSGRISSLIYFLIPLILGTFSILLFTRWRKLFFPVFGSWIILTGMFVNPIVIGAESVKNHALVSEALKINYEFPGEKWLCLNTSFTQNLLLANGITVLNAVNFYPDYGKWDLIDPEHIQEDYYNRYLHMLIELTSDPTSFSLNSPDAATIYLNPQDLKKWQVHFLTANINSNTKELLDQYGIRYDILYIDQASNEEILKIDY
ncbi:DUF7657 domain-containing protein [Dubosiella newyorkensis]|uniref:DUF7657 domain-containing protein n=1 Tax=Dubosiella newyorkensis TaxID=1862672 RepID=UPI0023F12982|nr:hypothetical protein [Dubosiella newyorkensis]